MPRLDSLTIDWESIESAYRAGTLSVSEIAYRVGNVSEAGIRKRAKRDGWQRDLTAKVQRAVRAKVVRALVKSEPVRGAKARTDSQITEVYAQIGADALALHRKDINVLRHRRTVLMEKYDAMLVRTDEAGKPEELSLDQIETCMGILERCSRLDTKIVHLERQAFNLDEPPEERPPDQTDPKMIAELAALKSNVMRLLSERAERVAPPAPERLQPAGAKPRVINQDGSDA